MNIDGGSIQQDYAPRMIPPQQQEFDYLQQTNSVSKLRAPIEDIRGNDIEDAVSTSRAQTVIYRSNIFDKDQLHSLRHQMLLKCWQQCSVLDPFTKAGNLEIVKDVFEKANNELENVLYNSAVAVVPTAQAPS